ncbi:hypothetical protein D3C87_323620 [compost metagenome]
MYLHWNQNGNLRLWNLSEKGVTRKLRKALKKATGPGVQYANLINAKNIADMHYAIYGLIGTPEFLSFEIKSDI